MAAEFQLDEAYARQRDADDPLRSFRDRFLTPRRPDGAEAIYLAGNSLGLQPSGVRDAIDQELRDWADLAVDAHFEAKTPWYSCHEIFREPGARLVGARPGEVVMMNSLTVNLHLMMVTFFQPTTDRFKVLMEHPAFPSDTYAVKTHLLTRGLDPAEALLVARPRPHEQTLRTEDLESLLGRHGEQIALVLLGGVNFFTGQVFDMPRITALAHRYGCVVGWDLAHAAGNVPLKLHDWNVDFAVWCSYKYLNAGPGAVAGCFIHERHAGNVGLPRYGGWWGNDPQTRFLMHLQPEFVPQPTAEGWQISNPPILSMVPLKVSLDVFDDAGMNALRAKSVQLAEYLQYLLDEFCGDSVEVITPRPAAERGCQLSLLIQGDAETQRERLHAHGVICDFRKPNVVRVAPTPLYNTFHDVWRLARILA